MSDDKTIVAMIHGFEKAGLRRPGICKIILLKIIWTKCQVVWQSKLNLKYPLKYTAYVFF